MAIFKKTIKLPKAIEPKGKLMLAEVQAHEAILRGAPRAASAKAKKVESLRDIIAAKKQQKYGRK